MSIVDRQIELSKHLFQINANALRAYGELQRDNVEKYFQLNAEYWEKLPTVKDFSEFVDLQRSYNESLWEGIRESTRTQVDLAREAFEETGDALREALQPEQAKPSKAKRAAPKRKRTRRPAKRKGAPDDVQTH